MAEQLHNHDERQEGRAYEVEQIIDLNELITETIYVGREGGVPLQDGALDLLANLVVAMARRDPELGQLLVDKLTERTIEREAAGARDEADRHKILAQTVYQEALLPLTDTPGTGPSASPGPPPSA
jgi:hypothetical protein